MKKILLLAAAVLVCANLHARERYQADCMQGGQTVSLPGIPSPSTTKFEQSFPGCTITVYVGGTLGIATLYNADGSSRSNPLTADSKGYFFFYADNGTYDLVYSGTGITGTISRPGVLLLDISSTCATSFCQGGNSFGATAILGTNDSNPLNLRVNGISVANFAAANLTLFGNSAGGQTLKLDNINGGSGASTSVNFYKNGVYVGMVGDRGTTGSISLQHSSGAEIILSSGVMSISAPGGGVLITGGGLTVGAGGVGGILAGGFSLPIGPVIDSSANITAGGSATIGGFMKSAYMTTANTGSLNIAASGTLNWGSVVVAGVTTPVVRDSSGTITFLGSGGGGSGTVTSVSAGDVGILATTSVATPTTTPAITYALKTAAPYSWLGNPGNTALAPIYVTSFVTTKTNDYTIVCASDYPSLINVSNAGTKTVTLPATECAAGWYIDVQNSGAGTWTINRNSLNIDGGTTNPTIATNGGIHIVSRGPGNGYWTQRGSASSGGSGCASVDPSACILKGSAANSGLNNDAADIALGLLSAHNVILATNSLQRAMITSGGNFIVGTNTVCTTGLACVFSASSANTLGLDSTGGTTTLTLSNSGTPQGYLYTTPTFMNLDAVTGYLALSSLNTEAARFDTSQRLIVGTTSAFGSNTKVTIDQAGSTNGLVVNQSSTGLGGVFVAKSGAIHGEIITDGTYVKVGSQSNVPVIFVTNSAEAFRINTDLSNTILTKYEDTSQPAVTNTGAGLQQVNSVVIPANFLAVGSVLYISFAMSVPGTSPGGPTAGICISDGAFGGACIGGPSISKSGAGSGFMGGHVTCVINVGNLLACEGYAADNTSTSTMKAFANAQALTPSHSFTVSSYTNFASGTTTGEGLTVAIQP